MNALPAPGALNNRSRRETRFPVAACRLRWGRGLTPLFPIPLGRREGAVEIRRLELADALAELLAVAGRGRLVRQHVAKPPETRVVGLGGVQGRIDVPARRRVVAVHVSLWIELRQVCVAQIHSPGQVGERKFAGSPLLFPLRFGPALLRFAPCGGLLPTLSCRVGSPLLRLQRRDLRVERGIAAVPRGFRSSFRDWGERTTRGEVVEAALARPGPRDVLRYQPMSTDTKAIIGTIVGTGLALAGLLSAQIAGVNARVDDVRADMREMRASMERFDSRLDAVEIALGKVDQRLLTIERVVLPSATPDE